MLEIIRTGERGAEIDDVVARIWEHPIVTVTPVDDVIAISMGDLV